MGDTVRRSLQGIFARELRPRDVVAFAFWNNGDWENSNRSYVQRYVSFLEEWAAIASSKSATLVVFGDQRTFELHPSQCARPQLSPELRGQCFRPKDQVMGAPLVKAASEER